jgi:hypothetical protein
MKCTFCSKHVSNIFPEDFHEGIYLCKRCIRRLKKEFRKEELESSSEVDQKSKQVILCMEDAHSSTLPKGAGFPARGTLMIKKQPWCCYVDNNNEQCNKDAKWTIHPDGAPPDICTDACNDHVGHLLEEGFSTVWSIKRDSTS